MVLEISFVLSVELSFTNSLVPCYCYIQVECNNSTGAVMCTQGCNAPSALNLKIKSFVKGVCSVKSLNILSFEPIFSDTFINPNP